MDFWELTALVLMTTVIVLWLSLPGSGEDSDI